MDKLCKFFWEKTPALRWEYHTRTTLQKSAKDPTPMCGTVCTEGSVTLPLCVIGAAILLTMVPCLCICSTRKKRKQCSQKSVSC